MSCIKTELIRKYIDREASGQEIAVVEKHLAVCPECTARLTRMQRHSGQVKKALDLLVNEDVSVPGFIAPVQRTKIREVSQRKILIFSLSAACALICIVTVALFSLKIRTPQQIVVVPSVDREINANLTVTQQQMVINVIDANGKVTEFPIK
jgi:anti-sigma factor RsiW